MIKLEFGTIKDLEEFCKKFSDTKLLHTETLRASGTRTCNCNDVYHKIQQHKKEMLVASHPFIAMGDGNGMGDGIPVASHPFIAHQDC